VEEPADRDLGHPLIVEEPADRDLGHPLIVEEPADGTWGTRGWRGTRAQDERKEDGALRVLPDYGAAATAMAPTGSFPVSTVSTELSVPELMP